VKSANCAMDMASYHATVSGENNTASGSFKGRKKKKKTPTQALFFFNKTLTKKI